MSYESGPWLGESGFIYIFHVYERGEPIPSRQGVYIYSSKNADDLWYPIYIGYGDLSSCCDDPQVLACIDGKGATHIHMRLCSDPAEGADEVVDLLRRSPIAYAPTGCNVAKAGGTATIGTSAPA